MQLIYQVARGISTSEGGGCDKIRRILELVAPTEPAGETESRVSAALATITPVSGSTYTLNINDVVKTTEDVSRMKDQGYKPIDTMQTIRDKSHADYVEKTAWIKQMLVS